MECRVCEVMKSQDEFAWLNIEKEIKSTRCKECQRVLSRKHYAQNPQSYKYRLKRKRDRNSELIYQYLLKNPCVKCGESEPLFLDFDHLDNKSDCVSTMSRSAGIEMLIDEMAKCQVLCLKCHRLKTAEQFNWYRWQKYQEIEKLRKMNFNNDDDIVIKSHPVPMEITSGDVH